MLKWILLGILFYLFIGLNYYSIVYLCYISDLENYQKYEYKLNKTELFIFCSLLWIILIPATYIYKIYDNKKGGKLN